MAANSTIRQSLASRLSNLRDNTIVIDNSDKLDLKTIQDGVLIVYATWSGPAIVNCTQTIRLLNEKNYSGQIIVIDNDCMTPDFEIKMFGQVCHGWGEIFLIRNGLINEKYFGKDSFSNFKADNERQKNGR